MNASSLDLRRKIVPAYDHGHGSQRALAALCGVSRGFVEQVMRRRCLTGELAPRPHGGGRQPCGDAPAWALVRHLVQAQPRCHPGRALSPATAPARGAGQCGDHGPHLATPGPATKKTSLHASDRETPRVDRVRARYQQQLATLARRRLTCVDAAGVNLAMTRLYGRAPQGMRVVGTIPQNDGDHITRLGALGPHGLQAVMTVNGATEADVFRASVRQVLGPTLVPGDIVVMDHRSAHQAVGVQPALARRGVRRLFLPPYAPDLSPMERCVSQLKTALRAAKARTREALETAVQQATNTVTAVDAQHWFRPCGYAI